MPGTMCSPTARSLAQYVMVPSVSSPASFSIFGASAAIMIGAGVEPGTVSIDENANISPAVLDVPGTRERGAQHLDVLTRVVRGAGVLEPVHALDDDRVRRADAEHQAAVGGGLGRHRLLRHGQRVPGVGGHHRGAELDAVGHLTGERERGQTVEAPRDVRHPAGR